MDLPTPLPAAITPTCPRASPPLVSSSIAGNPVRKRCCGLLNFVNAGLKFPRSAGRKIPRCGIVGLTKEPNAQPGGFYEHTRFEATGVESVGDRRRTQPRPQDRAKASIGGAAALQTGEPGTLQDRCLPRLPAGTMGEGRAQRSQTAGRDTRPRLCWRLLAVETGGDPMAGGRARESLRALRDRPWGAKPNGLGPLRQLGWTPPLWFRPDHVLLAHALHRVPARSTERVLTDRMKTVLLDQTGGELHFHQKFLQFAAYYGFVPRVCRPYRPETKGKIESTIRFVKQNFWPGIAFGSLADLNQQARTWMEKVNHQVHSTTRAVPYERWPQERLLFIDEQPDYDTSYMEDRRVAKDCMLSYRGNRYSVPFRFAGKTVLVREPVTGGRIEIYSEIKVIAEHRLAEGRGVMVSDPAHYHGLAERRRPRGPAPPDSSPSPAVELTPGPGVGRGF